MLLLLRRHSTPFRLPLLIDADVEQLSAHEDEDVVHADADKDSVTTAVEWFIVVSVDLRPPLATSQVAKERGENLRC